MIVRERNHSNGNSIATYLVGARGPEHRRDDSAGTIRWYLFDGLGSVLGEVDPSGTVTATRKFDVYGAVRSSTGTSTSKHKFVGGLGHPSEDETGLIYMQHRYCDPTVGRFISEDPAAQGDNLYAYCHNNPVNRVDPDGRVDNWVDTCIKRLLGLLASLPGRLLAMVITGLIGYLLKVQILAGKIALGRAIDALADWLITGGTSSGRRRSASN